MGRLKDLEYDIQEMFIDGADAKQIAFELRVPINQVQAVLNSFGVNDDDILEDEDFSPHSTINS